MRNPSLRFGLAMFVLAICAPTACQSVPDSERETRKRNDVVFEINFIAPEHELQNCLGDLSKSYGDLQEGVLFYTRDSVIRIRVPKAKEPYHCHLVHAVGEEEIEFLAQQNEEGVIEIDLSRYHDPRKIVLPSASGRLQRRGEPKRGLPIPPYSLSYGLVPLQEAEHLLSLQPFRYETKIGARTLATTVQPANRGDALVSIYDVDQRLSYIFRDAYLYYAPKDAYLTPRILVEVAERTQGKVFQRSGTWPLPQLARGRVDWKRSFSIRTARSLLTRFSPPPGVEIELPEKPPTTSAPINARFVGVGPKDHLQFVLSVLAPSSGEAGFAAHVQTHDVSAETRTASFNVQPGIADSSDYPLTVPVAHRFIQPWRRTGGLYSPVPARGTLEVARGEGIPRLHGNVIAPLAAAHYDFLTFFGDPQGDGQASTSSGTSISQSWNSNGSDSPSSNLIPPTSIPGAGPGAVTSNWNSGSNTNGGLNLTITTNSSDSEPEINPLAGGPPGFCGCGEPTTPGGTAPGCPRTNGKCKGTCGLGCPANGHCKPSFSGKWTFSFPCPPKGTGCGKDPKECKCPDHVWNKFDVLNTISSALKSAGGSQPADISWFGNHGATAPCHKNTLVARVRISYWGSGFSMIHKWYSVFVTFAPCKSVPFAGGKGKKGKEGPEGGPNSGGGGLLAVQLPHQNPDDFGANSHPFNDPNLGMHIRRLMISGSHVGLGRWAVITRTVTLQAPINDPTPLEDRSISMQDAYWKTKGVSKPSRFRKTWRGRTLAGWSVMRAGGHGLPKSGGGAAESPR